MYTYLVIRCQRGCANISSIQMPENSPRVPDIGNPKITIMQVNKNTSSATTFNIQLALTQILQVDSVDSKRVIESSAQFYFLH